MPAGHLGMSKHTLTLTQQMHFRMPLEIPLHSKWPCGKQEIPQQKVKKKKQ